MSIKVLVADDHEVVRRGLASLFTGTDLKIVGEAATADETVKQAVKIKPDVVLLDIRMGDSDGLDALEKIRKQAPHTKVVVDYVLKGASRQELIGAIHAAAGEEGPTKGGELRRVASVMGPGPGTRLDDVPLTQREMQVLRHIALGLSNKEIGKSLNISVETVKEHVQNILRKIAVNDRTQAAVWAVRKGLV
jgi:DNA-binding NarL/FixJ family response regulator